VIPFIIFFAFPFGLAVVVYELIWRNTHSVCKKIIKSVLIVLVFGVGLVLNIIVIPLGFIIGIPIVIITMIYERVRIRRRANRRIQERLNEEHEGLSVRNSFS